MSAARTLVADVRELAAVRAAEQREQRLARALASDLLTIWRDTPEPPRARLRDEVEAFWRSDGGPKWLAPEPALVAAVADELGRLYDARRAGR